MILPRIQRILLLLLALLLTGGGLFIYIQHASHDSVAQRDLEAARQHNKELQQHNEELTRVVSRLEFEKRVAEIVVTKQDLSASGAIMTTLRFVEYSRDGESPLLKKEFTIEGKRAHIDAMVIKFDKADVENGHSLRGHSIGLFTRLYGEKQSPENGFPIDDPRKEPEFYRGADPRIPQFEKDMWADFWNLAADPKYALTKGVLIAQGEGVWSDFEPNRLYTLNLQSDGNLNLTHVKAPAAYQNDFFQSTPTSLPSQP